MTPNATPPMSPEEAHKVWLRCVNLLLTLFISGVLIAVCSLAAETSSVTPTPTSSTGQTVITRTIYEGEVYYGSAWHFGSGTQGTVKSTQDQMPVYGYAYLNTGGEAILVFVGDSPIDEIPPRPPEAKALFVLVNPRGWFLDTMYE